MPFAQLAQGGQLIHLNINENISNEFEKKLEIDKDKILFVTKETNWPKKTIPIVDSAGEGMFFVHVADHSKQIRVKKSRDLIGITICDGGFQWTVIRNVWTKSDAEEAGISAGDGIENINGTHVRGWSHRDVAILLHSIPIGEVFLITVLKSNRSANIGPRNRRANHKCPYSSQVNVCYFNEETRYSKKTIDRMNQVLEQYLGLYDDELCCLILSACEQCSSLEDVKTTLQSHPDVPPFDFSENIHGQIYEILKNS